MMEGGEERESGKLNMTGVVIKGKISIAKKTAQHWGESGEPKIKDT